MAKLNSRMARYLSWSAGAFAVAAVGLFLGGVYLLRLHDWRPARVAFPVDRAERVSVSFISRTTVAYELRLDTERKLEFNDQNCLLGVEPDLRGHCERVKSAVDVDWGVWSGGELIAKPEQLAKHYGYWGPTVGATIGSFEAVAGRGYTVSAVVRTPVPSLQATNPHLEVGVVPHVWKDAFVWASVLQGASALVGSGAVMAFVLAGISELIARCRTRPIGGAA